MEKKKTPKVIFLVGPTAVGKTDLSIRLAQALDGEIVSTDSVQIYQKCDIGSAKPTSEELAMVKHHMIDCLDPRMSFSVSEYQAMAKPIIKDIIKRGKTPIVTGGTGLYTNALLFDMDFGQAIEDLPFRKEMETFAEVEGALKLHEKLKAIDPDAAAKIHFNNKRRVIRALEINHITGANMKDFKKDPVKTSDYDYLLIGLTRNRLKLYARIEKRVDMMLNEGLIEEVESLKKMGIDDTYQSMQGIGYKEVLSYLDNHYDYDTMVKLLKQNTRHYAKRQMTWFRRYDDIVWLSLDEVKSIEEQLSTILSMLTNKEKKEGEA